MTKERENQNFKDLLAKSEKLIRLTTDDFDYQILCDDLHALSGARFAAINIFDESGEKAETVAISGVRESISQAAGILGFK